MSKSLVARTGSDGHQRAPGGSPSFGTEIPAVEWEALAIARKTYPELSLYDQGRWLAWDHVNYVSKFSLGHFTLRLRASKHHGPSLEQHLTRGKTHMLFGVCNCGWPHEEGGKLGFLFLVDLRKAYLLRNEATQAHSDVPYLIYDTADPRFAKVFERLRT